MLLDFLYNNVSLLSSTPLASKLKTKNNPPNTDSLYCPDRPPNTDSLYRPDRQVLHTNINILGQFHMIILQKPYNNQYLGSAMLTA